MEKTKDFVSVNKRILLRELNLEWVKSKRENFGWKATSINPFKNDFVIEFERNEEMNNYEQIKKLEMQFDAVHERLMKGKYVLNTSNKLVSTKVNFFGTIGKTLLILFSIVSILFFAVNPDISFLFIPIVTVLIFVLTFLLSKKAKDVILEDYKLIDGFYNEAKKLL